MKHHKKKKHTKLKISVAMTKVYKPFKNKAGKNKFRLVHREPVFNWKKHNEPGRSEDRDMRLSTLAFPEDPQLVPEPEINVTAEVSGTSKAPTKHQQRKEETVSKWALIMPDLLEEYMVQQAPPYQKSCCNCGKEFTEKICHVKCSNCISSMCSDCAEIFHSNMPFHNLKVWNEDQGLYEPLSFKRLVTVNHPEMHSCIGHRKVQQLVMIDESGHCFDCELNWCSCQSLQSMLVSIGFWPSSPAKPTRAYHQGFLTLLMYLMLEGHMSLQLACQSLMWKNKWTPQKTQSIYRQLTTEECFEEFRHFYYRMGTLDGLCLEDKCAACPQDGGTCFISLDANFGLVRKTNAGTSAGDAKHGQRVFLNDDEVNAAVESARSNAGKSDNTSDCNQFQAGDSVRSKNKAVNLDKTGVFGSACRHGFPCKFLNMEHGERYVYPMLILKKLIEEKEGTSLVVCYDIACKLNAHIKKTNQQDMLEKIKLVLPCWHAYGHSAACQTMYSTRCVEGCGLCDGEEMERIWSYLRPFSSISKEMTASHRIDLLCDALFHYGRKKLQEIVESIQYRYEKALIIHQQAVDNLHTLLGGTQHTREKVVYWRGEERAQLQQTREKSAKLTWQQEYVSKLKTYKLNSVQLGETEDANRVLVLNQHCQKLEKGLKDVERKHDVSARWVITDSAYKDALATLEFQQKSNLIKKLRHDVAEYLFILDTQKKYSDGQSISIRIKKQVEKASRCVNNTIDRYNRNEFETEFRLPRRVVRKDALNTDNEIYMLDDEGGRNININQTFKRQAIRLLNMADRSKEEEALLLLEKKNVVKYYQTCCDNLQYELSCMNMQDVSANNRYAYGRQALILERIAYYENIIHEAETTFYQKE